MTSGSEGLCSVEIKACTMEQYIREEHGKPRFTCQFCGKGFYYRSFMLKLQRLHTGDFKECVCDLCGAVYTSAQVLNRHVRKTAFIAKRHITTSRASRDSSTPNTGGRALCVTVDTTEKTI